MTLPKADEYRPGQTNARGTIICGAKNRAGKKCTRYPVKGGTRCPSHGGKSPQSKAAAERRQNTTKADRELRALGYDPHALNLDPAEQLLRLVSDKAREVAWLRHMVDQVAQGGDQDDPLRNPLVWGVTKRETGVGPMGAIDQTTETADLNVWIRWLHVGEDALARYATAALKAGVQQRQLEIQEALALQFVGAIHQIIGALQLTAAQQQTAATIIPTVLRSLDNQEQT